MAKNRFKNTRVRGSLHRPIQNDAYAPATIPPAMLPKSVQKVLKVMYPQLKKELDELG